MSGIYSLTVFLTYLQCTQENGELKAKIKDLEGKLQSSSNVQSSSTTSTTKDSSQDSLIIDDLKRKLSEAELRLADFENKAATKLQSLVRGNQTRSALLEPSPSGGSSAKSTVASWQALSAKQGKKDALAELQKERDAHLEDLIKSKMNLALISAEVEDERHKSKELKLKLEKVRYQYHVPSPRIYSKFIFISFINLYYSFALQTNLLLLITILDRLLHTAIYLKGNLLICITHTRRTKTLQRKAGDSSALENDKKRNMKMELKRGRLQNSEYTNFQV